jgi:hypothetical protein
VSETPTQLKLVIEHSWLIDNRWVYINIELPCKVNRECICLLCFIFTNKVQFQSTRQICL